MIKLMGDFNTPTAENNDRIIRKLCCLSDYWGRRKFLKERGQHGDRLNPKITGGTNYEKDTCIGVCDGNECELQGSNTVGKTN